MIPKYIVFDSNCFINALNNKEGDFDYKHIKSYAAKNGAYITITAFTLYELIQQLSKFEKFDQFREQLISFGDFWVFGNGIMEHKGLEYGIDFLFLLSMQNNDNLNSFAKRRDELREKVYHEMIKKMFFYSILVTSAFVYMSECDDNGGIRSDTIYKLSFIGNRYFELHEDRHMKLFTAAYKHAGLPSYSIITKEFYTDYNAKKELPKYMLNLIAEIIATAEVELSLSKGEWNYSIEEYNRRLAEKYMQLSHSLKVDSFKKLNTDIKKRTKKRISIETVLDDLMAGFSESLKKECFHYMVEKLFNSGGFGERFSNDFIDFSNLLMIERFYPGETVYLTGDKKWTRFMELHKDNPFVKQSIEFSEQFQANSHVN